METTFAHIENLGGDGWIKVIFDDGLKWPLPEYLRVLITKTDTREEFKILESRFIGKVASVKKKGWSFTDWDGSYFEKEIHTKTDCPHKGPISLILYRKSEILEVPGLGKFNVVSDWTNPVPIGEHDIEIPYEPHPSSSNYNFASYYKTWFRIGHSGDRFLHCGSRSKGCITVSDISSWDNIYKQLIVSRSGFNNVGKVTVVDS